MLEFGCHAFLPNWLFWCRFFLHFVFQGALIAPSCPAPSVDEENLVGFQLHAARTFRTFFDGKKLHWRPQGPHRPPFMYRHHNTPFLIPDEKWVRRRYVWKAYSVCAWMYVLNVNVCLQGGTFLCVWACNERGRPGTREPHEGSHNLHN